MLIKDVMTKTPTVCRPSDTLDHVAKLMLEHDCGEIPV
jgi:CBS domain-containing protein